MNSRRQNEGHIHRQIVLILKSNKGSTRTVPALLQPVINQRTRHQDINNKVLRIRRAYTASQRELIRTGQSIAIPASIDSRAAYMQLNRRLNCGQPSVGP